MYLLSRSLMRVTHHQSTIDSVKENAEKMGHKISEVRARSSHLRARAREAAAAERV
jgi:phage shock protein A